MNRLAGDVLAVVGRVAGRGRRREYMSERKDERQKAAKEAADREPEDNQPGRD
jgi:hypothetical protein